MEDEGELSMKGKIKNHQNQNQDEYNEDVISDDGRIWWDDIFFTLFILSMWMWVIKCLICIFDFLIDRIGWYDPLFIIIWIKINEVIGPSRNHSLLINSNQMGSNNGEQ